MEKINYRRKYQICSTYEWEYLSRATGTKKICEEQEIIAYPSWSHLKKMIKISIPLCNFTVASYHILYGK